MITIEQMEKYLAEGQRISVAMQDKNALRRAPSRRALPSGGQMKQTQEFVHRAYPIYKRRGPRRKVKLNRWYETAEGAISGARTLSNKYGFPIDVFLDETGRFTLRRGVEKYLQNS